MAASTRSIGAWVLVSTGIIFTGVLSFRYVNGEVVANVYAAATERYVWPFGVDSEGYSHAITPPSVSKLGVFIDRDPVAFALGRIALLVEGQSSIRWLDTKVELPGSGGTILSWEPSWYLSSTNYTEEGRAVRIYKEYDLSEPEANGVGVVALSTIDMVAHSSYVLNYITIPEATNMGFAAMYYNGSLRQAQGTENDYYGGVGNWWTYTFSGQGLATNLYAFLSDSDNELFIRAGELSNAVTVVSNMTRTVYVRPPVVSMQPEVRDASASGGEEGDTLDSLKGEAGAVSWREPGYGDPEFTVSCVIRDISFSDGVRGGTDPYVNESRFISFDAYQFRSTGVRLGYPTAQACSSGMVSRVRIYAVALGSAAIPLDYMSSTYWTYSSSDGPPSGWAYLATSIDSTAFNYYSANFSLGVGSAVSGAEIVMSEYDDDPIEGGFKADQSQVELPSHVKFDRYYEAPNIIKWSLIVDVANPSEPPEFDFIPGADPFGMVPVQTAGYSGEGPVGEGPGGGTEFTSQTVSMFYQRVSVEFIVVVDWNFKFLNPNNPAGGPEVYTPPWLTP